VRRRRGQHERNFEEAIELGPSRHYQEIFNRLVAKHPELYELLFGLGFEYIIEDFFNNLEVADMRVMILLVEAWLAEALGLYSNSEESWKGTCSHSALIEGVRGVSNSYVTRPPSHIPNLMTVLADSVSLRRNNKNCMRIEHGPPARTYIC
jgi:hypothetical protein